MNQRGFTIFFAMLVGALALAVGAAIYDLTVREIDLSNTATQSQYAIYAADTGAECALYWDLKCTLTSCFAGSAFATSSASTVPGSGVSCNGVDIAAVPWTVQAQSAAATTTFTVSFSPQPYCVLVTVAKHGSPTVTSIVSHGYNTACPPTLPTTTRLERTLQVDY